MTRAIQNEPEDRQLRTPPTWARQGGRRTSRIRARRRGIVIAIALGAVVLGAAYLVSKPGSDKPARNGASAGSSYAEIESSCEFRQAS